MIRTKVITGVTIANNATYLTAAIDPKNAQWADLVLVGTMGANLVGSPTFDIHSHLSVNNGVTYSDFVEAEYGSLAGKASVKLGTTSINALSSRLMMRNRPNTSGVYLKFTVVNYTGQSFTGTLTFIFNVDIT